MQVQLQTRLERAQLRGPALPDRRYGLEALQWKWSSEDERRLVLMHLFPQLEVEGHKLWHAKLPDIEWKQDLRWKRSGRGVQGFADQPVQVQVQERMERTEVRHPKLPQERWEGVQWKWAARLPR
jgi:hypothetical protein